MKKYRTKKSHLRKKENSTIKTKTESSSDGTIETNIRKK